MGTLERGCKERLAPLRRTLPSSAKLGERAKVVLINRVRTAAMAVPSQCSWKVSRSPRLCPGSSRASWLSKQPPADLSAQTGYPKLGPDWDEGSLSSGTYSLSGAPPSSASPELHILPVPEEAGFTSQARSPSGVKESDILSDEDEEDDGFSEGGVRRGSGDSSSPTSAIEAQFLQLQLSEAAAARAPAPRVQPEELGDTPETQPKLLRRHFSAVKRKGGSSLKRRQEALLSSHSRSLDSQAEVTSPSGGVDLNALLEREFSVQSLTSVVNEDCFYDPAEGSSSGKVPSA